LVGTTIYWLLLNIRAVKVGYFQKFICVFINFMAFCLEDKGCVVVKIVCLCVFVAALKLHLHFERLLVAFPHTHFVFFLGL